ncbi:MAG: glycosyltransferase family 4 protein, partial [Candidatus Latescibacterota bacterium]
MSKPLNIAGLLFGSLKTTGGYQVFAYNLFRCLAERGHKITLFITANEYSLDPNFYNALPFPVSSLLPRTKGLAKYLPSLVKKELRNRQKQNPYDLWQIIGAYPAGFLATTLKGLVPLVLRTHGDDIQTNENLAYGQRLDQRRNQDVIKTLHAMDRVIALTPSVSACYRESHIPDDRIVEIPNGISLDRFQKTINKTQIRQYLGVPVETHLLLTVSRNHPKKGLNLIPEMATELKKQGLQFHWLIVGKDVEQLENDITQRSLNQDITLYGEVKAVPNAQTHLELPSEALIDIFCCADIFVF